jgi:hypothetical protein
MNLYQGKEKNIGIIVNTNIFPLLHLDDKLIVKPHQKFLILQADINLKYFKSIQRNNGYDISLQTIIDHGLIHDIYGTLEEILQSDLGKAIKEACKKLACVQGKYKIKLYSNPPKFTQLIRPASYDIYINFLLYGHQIHGKIKKNCLPKIQIMITGEYSVKQKK